MLPASKRYSVLKSPQLNATTCVVRLGIIHTNKEHSLKHWLFPDQKGLGDNWAVWIRQKIGLLLFSKSTPVNRADLWPWWQWYILTLSLPHKLFASLPLGLCAGCNFSSLCFVLKNVWRRIRYTINLLIGIFKSIPCLSCFPYVLNNKLEILPKKLCHTKNISVISVLRKCVLHFY